MFVSCGAANRVCHGTRTLLTRSQMNSVCRKIRRMLAGWLAVGMCWAQLPLARGDALPTFGATVVAPFGFCGRIYEIPEVQAQPAIALHGSMDTDAATDAAASQAVLHSLPTGMTPPSILRYNASS